MKAKALTDSLEIWGFEEDTVVFADGSFGFGLEAVSLDVSCWDEEKINQLAVKCAYYLNGLPENIDIQFVQDIKPGNSLIISNHLNLTSAQSSEAAQKLTQERTTRLFDLDQSGLLPAHKLYIFLRRYPARALLERPRLFSKPKRFEVLAELELNRELKDTERFRNDVESSLAGLGIHTKQLKASEIADQIYRQWNPDRPLDLQGYNPEDIRDSVLFSDIGVSESGFSIGEYHHRIVSLKLLPDYTHAAMSQVLRELPFDSRLCLSIHVPNQQKELESLQTQRRVAFSMARGKRSGVSDIESEAKFQDLETLIGDMIAKGEKVFHTSLNILLRSKDKEALDSQVVQTLMKFRDLAGAEGMLESLATFSIFSQLAIPNAKAPERSKAMKTSNLADMLPIYGPWRGHAKPSLLLRSRSGSLIGLDPFDASLTNYNHVVSGGSGSGKSFLTNILLLQILKEDPRIFIVDIGGSYKKLCENLSGQYIPLKLDSNVSLNPFDLLPGEVTPSNSKIKFLVGLIEMMTKEEGDTGLRRLERAEIEEAIQTTYETSPTPTLSTFKQIIIEHQSPEIKRLGRILKSWCGSTPYGQFVDRQTTIKLERSIVCFDLKGLEDFPDLQAICLYLITDFVWGEIQRDRSQKKFLVFDECWKLLENDSGSQFIAEVFRTFRKYFASAIAISQNIDDFAKSKVATAILSNSSLKWLLMQRGADFKRLREVLDLNESELSLVQTLRQERGVYSEALLLAGEERSVVTIESTPLEYWIATTDPRDIAEFEKGLVQPNASQLETLKRLSEKYPRGIAASQGESRNA